MNRMNLAVADRMQTITPFYVMELLQRARELEQQGHDIVHMEIGEPDFGTPDLVLNAGIQRLQQGQVKYTPAAGLILLREKIAEYYRQQYDVYVPIERIFITPGASGAFLLALGASVNPGDQLMQADPCYPCNSNFMRLFGVEPLLVPVDADTDFQLNSALIERSWSDRTRGVIIASPSNPTGTIITDQALRETIQMTDRLGGHFYSDEIYHGLVYQRQAQTALKHSDQAFVINSFSKYFGMTGWRIGWLIAPEHYCEAIEKLAQNVFISTSSIAQYAALVAFDEDNLQELEHRRQIFAERGQFLFDQLQEIGFDIRIKPEGAFYIYADCSAFSKDSFQFAKDLLEQAGVAVTPGKDFGRNTPEHYIRFAYTTDLERLKLGVERISRFINNRSRD